MAGKYKHYDRYVESGVPWQGAIPNHWRGLKLKFLFIEKKKNSNPLLPAGSISFGVVVYKNEDNLSEDTKESYREVLKGEFLINPLNLNYDLKSLRTALSDKDVVVSSGYIVVRATHLVDKSFARWLFHQFDVAHMKTLGSGVRQTLTYTDISNCYAFFPQCIDEQRAIGEFINHETAKIDALIEKQEKLIELLKEKRQAVISHAVTKGLNPDVPMKHSGIEWLGEVPEHWRIVKFSYVTTIQSGQVDPKESPYDQFDLIAPNHIESGTGKLLALETAQAQGADSGKYLCPVGCVIYSKIRPALAKVTLSPHENVICSADMYPIIGSRNLYNIFLKWTLLSDWFTSLTILESDRVAMPKINREKLAEVKIVVPPLDEQIHIASYLDGITTKLDSSITKGQEQIQLLKERKSSLISAAVTGKIDVRNWQPVSKEEAYA